MLGAGLLQMAWRQEVLRNIVRSSVCCSRTGLEVYHRFSSYEIDEQVLLHTAAFAFFLQKQAKSMRFANNMELHRE